MPDVYEAIRLERERAHAKHGTKSLEAADPLSERRLRVLLEEVGEVAREFNDAEVEGRDVDLGKLHAELVQVAAMAAAWADAVEKLEQTGAVDDMARRLAEKMGDPRPSGECDHAETRVDSDVVGTGISRHMVRRRVCVACGRVRAIL